MPRDIPVGNGELLVSFEKNSLLRELHFPYVGEENHVNEPFRIGVWNRDQVSWISDGWEVKCDYLEDSLVTNVELSKENLKIWVNDLVDFSDNIYLKKITIESEEDGKIKLFFAHNFAVSGNDIGDTAVYMPEVKSLVHMKGERYFLINVRAAGKFGIDFYACGDRDTWKDAEDGRLSNNSIAQGSVGSCISVPLNVRAHEKETFYYWIAVGKKWDEVKRLNREVMKKTPEEIFRRTFDYWKCWVDKEKLNYDLLPKKIGWLYRRSLLIASTQMNKGGSIIAASDSDAIQFNRDTYSYMWPRDASLIAYGFNLAGYQLPLFFLLMAKLIEKEGYFLHKFMPSGALGSSWHPWIKDHKPQLPIQEDETALVVWSLWQHYQRFKDLDLIRLLYMPLIRKAVDFMMNFRDVRGLPLPSYDLWEERRGVSTFTVSAVYGGLMAGSYFAKEFGEIELAQEYEEGAKKMREAMDEHLYLLDKKRFARMINFRSDGTKEIDDTLDASLYGIFAFGAYPADDEKVSKTMEQIQEGLEVCGGIARYPNDYYYQKKKGSSNPWFITTLWVAQYKVAKAKTKEELDEALPILGWVADHALRSGCLAEQVDPERNEPISVSPLTWSHGAYISVVQEYLNKLVQIEQCPHCKMPMVSKHRKERLGLKY